LAVLLIGVVMHRFLFTNFKIINQMAKQYIGSDEHWIDSVNQRYDENEKHAKEQMQESRKMML